YYLDRTAGMHFGTELEMDSFAKLVMANTDVTHLPAAIFSTPAWTLEVDPTKQFTGLGPDGRADPTFADDQPGAGQSPILPALHRPPSRPLQTLHPPPTAPRPPRCSFATTPTPSVPTRTICNIRATARSCSAAPPATISSSPAHPTRTRSMAMPATTGSTAAPATTPCSAATAMTSSPRAAAPT